MSLAALNDAVDELGPVRKDFKRHSGTGAPYVHDPTGATTLKGTVKQLQYGRPSGHGGRLEDKSNLVNWKLRVAAYGIATSKALVAGIAALDPNVDKSDLDRLVQQAIEAGKGNEAADVGTALHRMTERVDLGLIPLAKVPEVFKADVEALLTAREAAGLTVVDGMVELHAVCDELRLAGTFDRVLTDGTTRYIGDLKTGKVDHSQVNYSVQLAVYARSMLYDVETGERTPLDVDQTIGIIEHLPAGSGTCSIIAVDLTRGWELAKLADLVKVEAKNGCPFIAFEGGGGAQVTADVDATPAPVTSGKAAPTAPDQVDTAVPPTAVSTEPTPVSDLLPEVLHQTRVAWVRNRIAELKSAGHIRTVTSAWPEGVAKPPEIAKGTATWSPDDLDLIVTHLDRCEARWEMPFGDPDPAALADRATTMATPLVPEVPQLAQPDDGDGWANDEEVRALRNLLTAYLSDAGYEAQARQVLDWSKDGHIQSRPWNMGDPDKGQQTSQRRYLICLAALDCALELFDPSAEDPELAVRMALALAIGEDPQPVWRTGGILGSLTTEQARRLADIACTHRVAIGDDGTPQLLAAA